MHTCLQSPYFLLFNTVLDPSLGNSATRIGLGLPTCYCNLDNLHRLATGQLDLDNLLLRLPSQVILDYVKSMIKTGHHVVQA